jgi:carbon storage regulator
MLSLTRRVGEKLVVGNSVIIEVLAVSGRGVRLGVSAPRETSVHRYEVFVEIEESNRAANAAAEGAGAAPVEALAAVLRDARRRTENAADRAAASALNGS